MARTAVPVTKLGRGTFGLGGTLAAPAGGGVAIDQANGMKVSPKRLHKLALVIYNSKAGTIVTTVRKGVYPPAEDSGVGDLASAAQATVTFNFLTGLDGSRYAQANGDVNLDWDAGATGVVWAYEMPA
jgi:hypothetical protein